MSSGSTTRVSRAHSASTSRVLGPFFTVLVRPASRSATPMHSSQRAGSASVDSRTAALKCGPWPGGPPTGAVSNSPETAVIRPKLARTCNAERSAAARSPRFAPRPKTKSTTGDTIAGPAGGSCYLRRGVLDLTQSELIVIGFITFAVVSAPWWPRLGAALGRAASGRPPAAPETPPSDDKQQLS